MIIPVLSCKECKFEGLNTDPFENAKAFDELAYTLMRCLKIQGMPSSIGLLQDLDCIPENKRHMVKKKY